MGTNLVQIEQNFLVQALRSGHSIEDIANLLNVTTDAVEEVITSYGLRSLATKAQQYTSIDSKYDNLEDEVLTRLTKSLNSNLVPLSPLEYTRILGTLNAARRKTQGLQEVSNANGNQPRLVHITLPERLEVQIKLNSLNQIVEVDGRQIETKHSVELVKDLESLKLEEKRNERNRKLQRYNKIEGANESSNSSPADLL